MEYLIILVCGIVLGFLTRDCLYNHIDEMEKNNIIKNNYTRLP